MSEFELYEIIGSNISNLLINKNRTRAGLAEFMGVSEATVSNWCSGKKVPRMNKIDKIAEFFGVQRSEIIGKVEPKKEESEIFEKIRNLDAEDIRVLGAFVDGLLMSEKYKKEKTNVG